MIDKARDELAAAGVTDQPRVVLADAGYWHGEQIDELMGQGVQVLIRPTPTSAAAPGPAGTAGATRSCAASSVPPPPQSSTGNASA